jgi:hypothetical protein
MISLFYDHLKLIEGCEKLIFKHLCVSNLILMEIIKYLFFIKVTIKIIDT